jgi:anthranilate phosphoribosyltransferase
MTATDTPTWSGVLSTLVSGEGLTADVARWAMGEIMAGEASNAQVAGFLVGLRAKGESVEEMRALADVMLARGIRIEVPGMSVDIVGTGGDRSHTVNISTMAAMVVAACGVRVVKHGNRAASSAAGSADVLEALGVDLSLPPERVAAVAVEAGITFCFAQAFHPSMRHAAAVRRELAIATAFNFLGPLTNPGQPTYAAVGVADRRMAALMAGVFADRRRDAAVFRGDDGLDELTTSTTSSIWWVRDGAVREYRVDPQRLGLELSPISALRGGDAAHNAQVVRDIFAGERGPIRDAVLLNAGAALAITMPDLGDGEMALHAGLEAGLARAAAAVDSGSAEDLLHRWVTATRAP